MTAKTASATRFRCLCFCIAALSISGCAGYRLGSMLPADIRTVYVPTFINATDEPLIELETTRAAVNTIQRDGSLRLAPEDEADAILNVTLTEFRMQALAFDRTRRAAANEYRLFLTADAVMTRRTTGEVIARHGRITGDTTFIFTGDLTSAKQDALPRAAEDLAQLVISRMVETWQ